MGLVACKECGQNVSTDAESCPHCGAPLKRKVARQYGLGSLIVVIVVIGTIIYFASGVDNISNTTSNASQTPVAQNQPDAVDYAYALCTTMKKTGDVTQCKVNITPHGNSVDATIDTSGEEAKKICTEVASEMAKKTRVFAGKWELRIFSPYGQEGPISACTLD